MEGLSPTFWLRKLLSVEFTFMATEKQLWNKCLAVEKREGTGESH
jgi:hypothetical protein